MTNIKGSMDFIRYENDFDLSKRPIIKRESNELLELEPMSDPVNTIDELRINNFMQTATLPRQIPTIDEIEMERLLRYGPRVDINPQRIFESLRGKVVKVPARRQNGSVIHDPPLAQQSLSPVAGRNPTMRYMSFANLFNDFHSATYVLRNLQQQPKSHDTELLMTLLHSFLSNEPKGIRFQDTSRDDEKYDTFKTPGGPFIEEEEEEDDKDDDDDESSEQSSAEPGDFTNYTDSQRRTATVPMEAYASGLYHLFSQRKLPFPRTGLYFNQEWYETYISAQRYRGLFLEGFYDFLGDLQNPEYNNYADSFDDTYPKEIVSSIANGTHVIEIISSASFLYKKKNQ